MGGGRSLRSFSLNLLSHHFRRRTVDYFGPFSAAARGRTLWADPLDPPTLDATAAGALEV